MSGPTDSIIDVARELHAAASAWEPDARVLGNVRAGDIRRLCEAMAIDLAPEGIERHNAWYSRLKAFGLVNPRDPDQVILGWSNPPASQIPEPILADIICIKE